LIRFGQIKYIRDIENEICKLPYDLLYDGSEPLIEFKGAKPKQNFKIKAYIKWYEIFENETALHNTIEWFKTNQVYIKFFYDNRINEASLKVSEEGLLYLCRRLPQLEEMVDKNTNWKKGKLEAF
jgi:hypothetical protein